MIEKVFFREEGNRTLAVAICNVRGIAKEYSVSSSPDLEKRTQLIEAVKTLSEILSICGYHKHEIHEKTKGLLKDIDNHEKIE